MTDPVFLIYAHTDPGMFGRIVRALQPYRVIAHIDKKSNIAPFLEAAHGGAEFTSQRVNVHWAGYSQVEAIRILVDHVRDADPASHLVLLSGQCYLARPVSELADYLGGHPGQQFIRSFEISAQTGEKYTRQIRGRHYRDLPAALPGRRVAMKGLEVLTSWPSRTAPHGIRVTHGQAHWAVTNECAQELLSDIPRDIERYFRRCFAPDEKVVHSLVVSSRFAGSIHGGGPVPYVGPGNWRYTNFHYIEPSLRPLTLSDLDRIRQSGRFFARKVTSAESIPLVDALDRRVFEGEGA